MAHIAKSPHNSLKNNDRFEAHIAPFYLAIGPPTPSYSEIAADSGCRKEPFRPKWRNESPRNSAMKTMSAREAKNGFGLMIDTARAEPVLIEKHGRGVVVVVSVEEYERLNGAANAEREQAHDAPAARRGGRNQA